MKIRFIIVMLLGIWLLIVIQMSIAVAADVGNTPTKPEMNKKYRVMLSETFGLWQAVGDSIWSGWTSQHIPVLLIDDPWEYWICARGSATGFECLGFDPLLKRNVFARKRTQRPELAASFPIVVGKEVVPTVLIGTPEVLHRGPTYWVLTVMHEMFHVLQSYEGEFQKTNSLKIGPPMNPMWQIDFAFPYVDSVVVERLSEMGKLTYRAITSIDTMLLRDIASQYVDKLDQLRKHLDGLTNGKKNYNYLRLQCWKEGVARYTEEAVCLAAVRNQWKSSAAFEALEEYETYKAFYQRHYEAQRQKLQHIKDSPIRRETFYTVGHGEALILDRISPGWKQRYFDQDVWLDDLLKEASTVDPKE